MSDDQRYVMDIVKPHPIEGTVVALLGVAILTYLWWLPPQLAAQLDSSKLQIASLLLGGVATIGGIWRLSWRHVLVVDPSVRSVSWRSGFFGWGKSGSAAFEELFSVRIRRELRHHRSTNSGISKVVVRYPISLEGPSLSINAGWSGYHGESLLRAESLAQRLGVEVQDLS